MLEKKILEFLPAGYEVKVVPVLDEIKEIIFYNDSIRIFSFEATFKPKKGWFSNKGESNNQNLLRLALQVFISEYCLNAR